MAPVADGGGGQQWRLQQLRADVLALVGDSAAGVPCRDLIKLYRYAPPGRPLPSASPL